MARPLFSKHSARQRRQRQADRWPRKRGTAAFSVQSVSLVSEVLLLIFRKTEAKSHDRRVSRLCSFCPGDNLAPRVTFSLASPNTVNRRVLIRPTMELPSQDVSLETLLEGYQQADAQATTELIGRL